MRPLITFLMLACLSTLACACGSSKTTGTPSTTRSSAAKTSSDPQRTTSSEDGYRVGDDDSDDLEHPGKDPDDQIIRGYGQPANASTQSAILPLVKRYYAAAAAGDGRAACAMIYAGFTRGTGILHAVPSVYTPAPGSSVLQGKSCEQVASLLFKLDHRQLVEDTAGLRVVEFRVKGASGLLMLGFKLSPERWLPVRRKAGGWKIAAFLDSEVP